MSKSRIMWISRDKGSNSPYRFWMDEPEKDHGVWIGSRLRGELDQRLYAFLYPLAPRLSPGYYMKAIVTSTPTGVSITKSPLG